MLVSPTEPATLRALGRTSSVPERYGADFLIHSPVYGAVGVQRKEISDLISSTYDGRLAKEFGQLRQLPLAVLLIEGRLVWTDDGYAMGGSSYTKAQHQGMLWSAQSNGLWIANSEGVAGTCEWLSLFTKWTSKPRHSGFRTRPGPRSAWGKVTNREWGEWLLQSFPGIGPDVARAIYDHFGTVPLSWTVNELDLLDVKGIGKGRARELLRALDPPSTPPSS